MSAYGECVRYFFRLCVLYFIYRYVVLKHWLLAPYYRGIAVQAKYLYRTSDLFKERWKGFSYEYAKQGLTGDIGIRFFNEARRAPWRIRGRSSLTQHSAAS